MNNSITNTNQLCTNLYLYYYTGHKSPQFGHEYIQYELNTNILYYTNNSRYRHDSNMIQKSVQINGTIINEIIYQLCAQYNVLHMHDNNLPEPNDYDGKQLFHIEYYDIHTQCTKRNIIVCSQIESQLQASTFNNNDAVVQQYYYFTQNIKLLFQSLMTAHFKVNPI